VNDSGAADLFPAYSIVHDGLLKEGGWMRERTMDGSV
jgi:hypothetical protein